MKNIILLFCLTILSVSFANAQVSKKHNANNATLAAANGEYWQSSSDEGLVKCGRGYFMNKMVIKTNYDTPDDMMDVNETTDTTTTTTKTSTTKVTPAKTEVVVASK